MGSYCRSVIFPCSRRTNNRIGSKQILGYINRSGQFQRYRRNPNTSYKGEAPPHFPSFPISLFYPTPCLGSRGTAKKAKKPKKTTGRMTTSVLIGFYSMNLGILVCADTLARTCAVTDKPPDQAQAIAEFRTLISDLSEAGLRVQVRHGHGSALLVCIRVPRDHLGNLVHQSRCVGT